MSQPIELFADYEQIIDYYTIVGEWEIWLQHAKLGKSRVAIRIKQDRSGQYFHDVSHFYQPGKQSAPDVLEQPGQHSPEAAIRHAMNQLLTHYRADDADAEWIVNENY
ncbi:hypothetical protein [Paenibacillus shenyangensis]|uniref:hypothetical protein n=1 Tax=Paenibacillus sp. A9 TaxID=1284352 RepID=UPI000377DF96|nr:hypothetical protein [Paenibacillus sp. A9]